MTRLLIATVAIAATVACAPTSVDISLEEDGVTFVDPNSEEVNEDVFYDGGGWQVDTQCNEGIQATGNAPGDITDGTALLDQFGEEVNIHDFCGRAILIVTGAFW